MAVAIQKKKKKNRRRQGLLALLLLLLGVSGGGFAVGYFDGTRLEGTKRETQLLPDFDPATIVALTLEKPPEAAIEIVRGEAGRWQITAPSPFPADAAVVDDLLLRLQRAEALPVKPITSSADLAAVGLDAPSLRVKLRTASALAAEVEIGHPALGSDGSFARRVGAVSAGHEQIVTLPGALVVALSRELQDLRAHELFRIDPESVTGVQVLAPEQTVMLSREGAGWRISEPMAGAADRQRARELVSTLVHSQAVRFLKDDPGAAATGLDHPDLRVRLEQTGGEWSSWLDVGGTAEPGLRYARKDGELLTLKSDLVSELLRDPARFRDRDLIDLPYDKVVSLAATALDGQQTALRRDDGGHWSLEVSDDVGVRKFAAEDTEVALFLQRLDQMEIDEFVTRAALDPPVTPPGQLTVELGFAAGEPMRFQLEPPPERGLQCSVIFPRDPTAVYRVPARLFETVADLELAFRSRSPWAAPAVLPIAGGDWELDLEQHPASAEPRHYKLQKQAGADWHSVDGGTVNSAAVDAVCMELLHLKARGLAEHWDGKSRPSDAPPGNGFLAKVRLSQSGDAGAASWSLEIHGQAMTHPPLFVATSAGYDLVMLIGDQTALRFVAELE